MQDAIDALHTRMSRRVRRARAHDLNGLAQNVISATIGVQRVLKPTGLLESDDRLKKCLHWIESSVAKISASATDLLPLAAQNAAAAVRFDYTTMMAECARLARDELAFAEVDVELQNLGAPCFMFAKPEQIRDCVFAVIFALSDGAKRPGKLVLHCELQDRFAVFRGSTQCGHSIGIDHSVDLLVAREIARSHGGDATATHLDSIDQALITLRLALEAP